jgi:hypothetical protein
MLAGLLDDLDVEEVLQICSKWGVQLPAVKLGWSGWHEPQRNSSLVRRQSYIITR